MRLSLRLALPAFRAQRCPFSFVASRTIVSRASLAYTNPSHVASHTPASSSTPGYLNTKDRQVLNSAIRVDQAGEIAANWIYKGQMLVLGDDPRVGPVIHDMWAQEKRHIAVMNKLQIQHRARPTFFSGVAKLAGFGLGACTAMIGREAAMACTEAVETVIGEHYDDQLIALQTLPRSHPSIPLLAQVISEFRDDELEHLDTAVHYHSQRAPAHALLSTAVSRGCELAIWLCKRV